MRWIEAAIQTRSQDIDQLCLKLADLGVEGMSIEDEEDFKRFLEQNHRFWDYVDEELAGRFAGRSQIKFYLEDSASGRKKLREIEEATGLEVRVGYVDDEDWENCWKDSYKPIEVGRRLLVVPEWENPELGGRLALRLEPGLTFGTGSHATTKMCLEALEDWAGPGKKVLDLGCGSGILGIGAMVLGCGSVVGCDIDPKSPEMAVYNASLNGIEGDSFRVRAGDILSDEGLRKSLGGGYDIVLANIVADVIIPLSGFARRFMAPGGVFICSGIIEGRQEEVRSALERNGFEIKKHLCQDGEWHCFTAV